jgi:putative transcriptional regulator
MRYNRIVHAIRLVRTVNIRPQQKALLLGVAVIALWLVVAFVSDPLQAGGLNGLLPIKKPTAPMLPEQDLFAPSLPAKGKFLVASRRLADPRFRETVVLLISYGADGATGVIINRPTGVRLVDMLSSVQGLKDRADVVYYGGPVEGNRMLMLIRSGQRPEGSGSVFEDVYFSSSKNTLENMLNAHKTAKQLRVYAGYAGWLPRQLDGEVSRGDWLIVGADARSIFEKKQSEVWPELIRRGAEIQVWDSNKPGPAERRQKTNLSADFAEGRRFKDR